MKKLCDIPVKTSNMLSFEVIIADRLFQLMLEEVDSPLNRLGAWQVYGRETTQMERLQYYMSVDAHKRLAVSQTLVTVKQT